MQQQQASPMGTNLAGLSVDELIAIILGDSATTDLSTMYHYNPPPTAEVVVSPDPEVAHARVPYTSGDDVIIGTAASEELRGGGGRDTFVIAPGGGHDYLADFGTGAFHPEKIDLTAFTGLQSFADLDYSNNVISFPDGGSVTVKDHYAGTKSELKTENFIFYEPPVESSPDPEAQAAVAADALYRLPVGSWSEVRFEVGTGTGWPATETLRNPTAAEVQAALASHDNIAAATVYDFGTFWDLAVTFKGATMLLAYGDGYSMPLAKVAAGDQVKTAIENQLELAELTLLQQHLALANIGRVDAGDARGNLAPNDAGQYETSYELYWNPGSSGSYFLRFDDEVTADLPLSATAAQIDAALEALGGVLSATVEGDAGGPYSIDLVASEAHVLQWGDLNLLGDGQLDLLA